MSPWEYQDIRKALGHGSGFDSPGFREIRRVSPALGEAFHAVRRARGLSVAEVYVRARARGSVRARRGARRLGRARRVWRVRHYKVVARIIGEDVVGTQGTPVELLGGLSSTSSIPSCGRSAPS